MSDAMSTAQDVSVPVVCVDVDQTLIRTDLLYETFLSKLKQKPLELFGAVASLLFKGKARLKEVLAKDVSLDFNLIPLNESVVEYLVERSNAGMTIVLASASHHSLVEKIAARLPFPTQVLATSDGRNLKGAAKADAIIERYGEGTWEYIGDAPADFAVWDRAARVVCATGSAAFFKSVRRRFPNAHLLKKPALSSRTLAHALRIHQWMKNVLLFLPLLLSHQWQNVTAFLEAFAGAISFSLCASAVYLLNDLLDLDADRAHPRKRFRPCASGALSLLNAFAFIPFLLLSSFGVALSISVDFALLLAIYVAITTAYSLKLKALILVDIIVLAMLYTIRIIAGGVAADVHVSQWLLGLSMFLFVSLACVKRYSELLVLRERNQQQTKGRGYSVDDADQIAAFGSSSAYISVLVLALYVSSKEVAALYHEPKLIWLACPLLLYWVSRIWLLARRGLVHDDPLVFALTDKVTYAVGAIALLIFAAAKW